MNNLQHQVREQFEQHFGKSPEAIICSPGRVNLIGEHTDYNDGFVLPMAIERATYLAFGKVDTPTISIRSQHKKAEINLKHLQKPGRKIRWTDYIQGVAAVLQKTYSAHIFQGFNAVIISDLPIGAGLSSSASFELAIAKAFSLSSGLPWNKVKMAKLCQKAENQWVGVNCGIMDQLICAVGEDNHASLLDCRDLSTQAVPLPANTRIVIMDTGTRRGLVGSLYNERRSQCEEVASALKVKALRDVSLDMLYQHQPALDPIAFKRAHHVVSENARVLEAVNAMEANDAKALGQLMLQSHHSLNSDFEVSNEALNAMVNIAKDMPGCFGARMTGAGFGGCAVALVDDNSVDQFIAEVKTRYENALPYQSQIFASRAKKGCDIV